MLDYEWGNPSTIMLSGEDPTQDSDPTRQIFDHYSQAFDETLVNNPTGFPHNFHPPLQNQAHFPHFQSFYDPRALGASYQTPSPAMLSLQDSIGGGGGGGSSSGGFVVVPKAEPDFAARIGLNLGGRTYFSSSEDDFVSRLYRRSRAAEPGSVNAPRCQAEGCHADLTHAKHYHRRHKVCEFHSKAATVVAAGLTQRFCQQCSRFHLLSEFDNGKRSCRKRLADHNRRRRKSAHQEHNNNKPKLQIPRNPSSDNLSKSPQDSGAQSSSSVTIAISPPRMRLECFRGEKSSSSYQQGTVSSSSTSTSVASRSSLFYSNG